MSLLLSPSDPYSILHALIWGRAEKGSTFLKEESIDIPTQDDLSTFESTKYNILGFGSNLPVFPNGKHSILVREEYNEIWPLIQDDRHTPGHQFGGTVVTGQSGIGKLLFAHLYTMSYFSLRKIHFLVLLPDQKPASCRDDYLSNREELFLYFWERWCSSRTDLFEYPYS